MLLKAIPGPRSFKVGDRALIVDARGCGPSLGGDHRIAKITRTHYHVRVPHYSRPSLYRIDTCEGKDWGGSIIMTVAEADVQHAAYVAGKGERVPNSTLFYGEGEY